MLSKQSKQTVKKSCYTQTVDFSSNVVLQRELRESCVMFLDVYNDVLKREEQEEIRLWKDFHRFHRRSYASILSCGSFFFLSAARHSQGSLTLKHTAVLFFSFFFVS